MTGSPRSSETSQSVTRRDRLVRWLLAVGVEEGLLAGRLLPVDVEAVQAAVEGPGPGRAGGTSTRVRSARAPSTPARSTPPSSLTVSGSNRRPGASTASPSSFPLPPLRSRSIRCSRRNALPEVQVSQRTRRVHPTPPRCFVGGEEAAHPDADQPDARHAGGGKLVDGGRDAGQPGVDPAGVGLVAGGVAGSVVVEPQDRQSLLGQPVRQLPVGEVDADRFDPQRLAEHDAAADLPAARKVEPPEQRSFRGPEPTRGRLLGASARLRRQLISSHGIVWTVIARQPCCHGRQSCGRHLSGSVIRARGSPACGRADASPPPVPQA